MFILPPRIKRATVIVRSKSSLDGSGDANIHFDAERLDDHFLNVTIFFMGRADRQQRVHAFLGSLTDTDQDARRKGHGQLASIFDGP
jgi:hypothetical protein